MEVHYYKSNFHFPKMVIEKSPSEALLQKKSSIQQMDFKKVLGPTYTKLILMGGKGLVKKYVRKKKMNRQHDHVIVISSEMSCHKNILKIIGYCLEFERVALVYEYSQFDYLFNCTEFLTWEKRVKIAIDVASVILYLHTEFPRPIIHRNLTSKNVILDQNGVAKLYNFECCIPLSIGKVQDDLIGTIGYLDPEYVWSSNVILKSDVFSFGLFLLMLLSGNEIKVNHEGKYYREDYGLVSLEKYASLCIENNKLENNLIDAMVLQEEQKKLKAFMNLALRCAKKVGENRPI